MTQSAQNKTECRVIERQNLDDLFKALAKRGYRIIGPTLRDDVIVYDEICSSSDLPEGWTAEQDGGKYRLKKSGDPSLFRYASSPDSWKKYLHPPVLRLWRSERNGQGFRIVSEEQTLSKTAFIGVRACDLQAIAIQDKVFLDGEFADVAYRKRREQSLIVAVNCSDPGGTCFCASMGTGPKAESGFDISLTEIVEPQRHYFTAEPGTSLGEEILGDVPNASASPEECQSADALVSQAQGRMGRTMDTTDIHSLLQTSFESRRWEEIALRCLTCANCTMVCPTCFCTNVEDVTDLSGARAERIRTWDSCFSVDFSYIHGGSVRQSAHSRYRQWLTHKLASWMDQFGTSGCVGCGRCITWCPVGIDITEEVEALRRPKQRISATLSAKE
ncbi:MAG: 4Fe-4S dicluster domain-containing protein [bacterium]